MLTRYNLMRTYFSKGRQHLCLTTRPSEAPCTVLMSATHCCSLQPFMSLLRFNMYRRRGRPAGGRLRIGPRPQQEPQIARLRSLCRQRQHMPGGRRLRARLLRRHLFAVQRGGVGGEQLLGWALCVGRRCRRGGLQAWFAGRSHRCEFSVIALGCVWGAGCGWRRVCAAR